MRPTALMILYHNGVRSNTSPTHAPDAPSSVSSARSDVAGPEAASSSKRVSAEEEEATPPTGRYMALCGRPKLRQERPSVGHCPQSEKATTTTTLDHQALPHEKDFITRRKDLAGLNNRPLSRISEVAENEPQNGAVATPVSKMRSMKIASDARDNVKSTDDIDNIYSPLSDSLCPKVLLAARDKAKAAAIAKENEGTRTMSREEIDEAFSGIDSIAEKIMHFDVSTEDKYIRQDSAVNVPSDHLEDEGTSDSNTTLISIRSKTIDNILPPQSSPTTKQDLPPTICPPSNFQDCFDSNTNQRQQLDSSELESCISSVETRITDTVTCQNPHKPEECHVIKAISSVSLCASVSPAQKAMPLETSLDDEDAEGRKSVLGSAMSAKRLRLASADSSDSATACVCGGISKHDWKAKWSSLREAELSCRDRERELEDRERELLKREKRVIAMEQDAKQHLVRANIYLRQARTKATSPHSINTVRGKPVVSPANEYRYSSWLEPGAPAYRCRAASETSVDAAESIVVLTAAAPQLTRDENPFLQMRDSRTEVHCSDPCVALPRSSQHHDSATDDPPSDDGGSDMFRRPSVPAEGRKGHQVVERKTNTLDNPKRRKKKLETVNSTLQAAGPSSKAEAANDSASRKNPASQLKLRSNNIFSSFRSGNKPNKAEVKSKVNKTTSFRLPLLPSRKGFKKNGANKENKENIAHPACEPKIMTTRNTTNVHPSVSKLRVYAI